jgi:hypothetical protein
MNLLLRLRSTTTAASVVKNPVIQSLIISI